MNYHESLYAPLLPSQTRLLRLSSCADDAPELGSLEVVDLDSHPAYYALSHSWDDGHDTTDVRVGGHRVVLSVNLVACIRRLAELGDGLQPRVEYVWIDNVCINQEDVAERSVQVTLMGRVYRQSVRTLIWLGRSTADTVGAWELLDDIYGLSRRQYPEATDPSDMTVRMYSEATHASSGLPGWDDDKWAHLRALMGLRWFSRIWVVQEVALSRLDPVLLHGRHCYSWERLAWTAAWLRRSGYMRLRQMPEQLRNVDTMASLQRSRAHWHLDALMSITQVKFSATDQRDKVYGLLGLAAECQDPAHLAAELQPNYGVAVPDLYLGIARFLMRRSLSLAMLTRAHGVAGSTMRSRRRHVLALPSWAPDWSDFEPLEELPASLSWVDYADRSRPGRLGFHEHYGAAAGAALELEPGPAEDATVLRLRGMRVDGVARVTPFNVSRFRDRDPERRLDMLMVHVVTQAASLLTRDNLDVWTEQFVGATTARQQHLGGHDWEQSLKNGLAYLHQLLAANTALLDLFSRQSGSEHLLELLRQRSAGGVAEDYDALVRTYGFDRVFLTTSSGRMGLGPATTRPEDTVAVLPGGDVPYCIRREADHWLFLGEAYVEGLMAGEAMQACEQGVYRKEVLTFR